MQPKVCHQVKTHIPRHTARTFQANAARDGQRTGTLARVLIRQWLSGLKTQASHEAALAAPCRRRAGDLDVKVLITDDDWSRLRQIGREHGVTVCVLVSTILRTQIAAMGRAEHEET